MTRFGAIRKTIEGHRWISMLAIVLVVGMLFLPIAATFGSSTAPSPPQVSPPTSGLHVDSSGLPSNNGWITNDHHFLIFSYIVTFGTSFQVISNGSQVFSDSILLDIYSLVNVPQTITISSTERGNVQTQSTTVLPGISDVITVNLAQDANWVWDKITVDFTSQYYQVAVPFSFLPSDISTVGGLDLVALAIISEAVVSVAIAVSLSFGIMRKALYARPFSLVIWGHVILLTILGGVILDFQQVDQVFAGWSPLVYAFALFPIFLVWSFSFFNNAGVVEMLQANAPLAGRLSFNRWELRVAKDLRGRYVLIGERRRDFIARIFGHHVPITTEEEQITLPEPFFADVINRRAVSKETLLKYERGLKRRPKRTLLGRIRRPSPGKTNAMDDFDCIPVSLNGRPSRKREMPSKIMWTPIGKPVTAEFPKLQVHKQVEVPPKLDKTTGAIVVPAHMKRALTWPHYSEGSCNITLSSIHFRSATSVIVGWRRAEDLASVLQDTVLDLESLKASFQTQVAKLVREKLTARESLIGRGEMPLSEEETEQESEREKATANNLDALFGRGTMVPKNMQPVTQKDST